MYTSTFPFPYAEPLMSPRTKTWTTELWAWLKGPGSVILAIFVALFVAGKWYGSDTSDTRHALDNHTMQLQAATLQAQTLNGSIIDLTRATQETNKRQDVQQSAMIELIRAVMPLIRSAERRQHLQEVLDGMKKVGRADGDFANGYPRKYISSR
jgi:hypothetical protein